MATHIVLQASGKDWDISEVKVKIFNSEKEAQNYCKLNTKRDASDGRYWTRAEMKKDGESFEFI